MNTQLVQRKETDLENVTELISSDVPIQSVEISLEKKLPVQGKFEIAQRVEAPKEEETVPLQMKKENKTGLPDDLKAGVEELSGVNMSDVKVHYNSDKPLGLGAVAYTQGTDIHVASGMERYLPHEAWHVAQQTLGRVRPTVQMNRIAVNDDPALEREADLMGSKALQRRVKTTNERDSDHKNTDVNLLQLHKELHGVAKNVRIGGGTVAQLEETGFIVDKRSAENGDKILKSTFLNQLKTTLTEVAGKELAVVGQTSADCPFIDYWISYYSNLPAEKVEKGVNLYVPETEGLTDPDAVIKLIAKKVENGLREQIRKGGLNPVDTLNPSELSGEGGKFDELTPPAQLKATGDVVQLGISCICCEDDPSTLGFTPNNIQFATFDNGVVGSIYFPVGRIRLIHPSGPDVEINNNIERFTIDNDTLTRLAYPVTILHTDRLFEYLENRTLQHTSRGCPGPLQPAIPLQQVHIDKIYRVAKTNNNINLRNLWHTDPVLQQIRIQ